MGAMPDCSGVGPLQREIGAPPCQLRFSPFASQRRDANIGELQVAKPEWGTKRICHNCGVRFYDLRRDPAACPACGTVVEPGRQIRPRRGGGKAEAAAILAKVEEEKVEIEGVEEDVDVEEVVEEDGDVVAEEEDLIEDASDLGEDDDDIGEVIEHIDEDIEDRS